LGPFARNQPEKGEPPLSTISREREELAEYRREHVPLYNANRLKLGVFSMNCSGGMVISKLPTSHRIEWDYQLELARQADALGIEAFVPVARWRGVGGEINFGGSNFEPFTYAAALAASTEQIMTFTTVHVPIIHPIVAAKMTTTIDHVSSGRAGVNVVMGWLDPEFAMFGIEQRDHERRYQFGSEWIDVVDRLWKEVEPFDYDGEFFKLAEAQAQPKPIQPRPVIFNAGGSPTGAAWAARHADFNFGAYTTAEAAKIYVDRVKSTAREDYDREIGVLTYALVVCRDTEAEARDALAEVIDQADWVAANNWISVLGVKSGSFDDNIRGPLAQQFVAGAGAAVVVGTPEQVVDQLQEISDAGMDGVMLGFTDWNEHLAYFGEHVMPLLRQSGLRCQ
jgi:alkanesulfonate monooxygenase SsuD/methylene tetrahydromethanopterin reductase-like flavin-dependent oxidoreductase (luciferase family)